MITDPRLARLMSALTARERAILILRSWKNKQPEDPLWRRAMSADQSREFNRYIDLMNLANQKIGHLITFIEKEAEKLGLVEAWFFTLHLWRINLAELNILASAAAREPITQTEHQKLLAKAEKGYLSLHDAAWYLAEQQRGWEDRDLESVGATQELVVQQEPWERLCAQAEQQLRQAVADGVLEARGEGKRMSIRRGSFHTWIGRPVSLKPEWADAYEVVDDSRGDFAASRRKTLDHLQQALEGILVSPHIEDGVRFGARLETILEQLSEMLRSGIVMRWTEIRVVDILLEEIAGSFDGEDPLKPNIREGLEKARASVEKLARVGGAYGWAVELEEPTEADVQEFRDALNRGEKLLG